MPAAIAVPAIIGAAGIGTNVAMGLKGAGAAKSAAQLQADAAAKAGQQVIDTAHNVNPVISDAAANAGAGVTQAAGEAGAGVYAATDRANGLLDPYRAGGDESIDSLRTLLAPGGDLNRNFTMEDFTSLDPGYNFRLQEAQRALERSAAARGGAMSGAALKDLTRFSQGFASEEFGKAFDRFQNQQNNRFMRLSDIAKLGYSAAGTEGDRLVRAGEYSGNAGMGAAEYSGNAGMHAADLTAANEIEAARAAGEYATQGANAQAAGKVGAANAYGNMANGIVNSVSGALTLRQLMSRPPVNYSTPTATLWKLPQRPSPVALDPFQGIRG